MTDEEIAKCASIEFDPIVEFIGKPLRPTEEELRGLGVNGRVAMETVRKTKPELVAGVGSAPEAFMEISEKLAEAAESFASLAEMCRSAAARVDIVLSVLAVQEVGHAH